MVGIGEKGRKLGLPRQIVVGDFELVDWRGRCGIVRNLDGETSAMLGRGVVALVGRVIAVSKARLLWWCGASSVWRAADGLPNVDD